MSSRSVRLRVALPQPQRPSPELIKSQPRPTSMAALRVGFWGIGMSVAAAQAWIFRYQVSTDSISYLDMSDGVMPGSDWHRLINGVWSPLYPFLLGAFRRTFNISPANEIVAGHLLNVGFFLFAFICFELFLRVAIQKLTPGDEVPAQDHTSVPLPRWAYLFLGYSLFLWASIFGISVRNLRADMLMSGFVYLAVALLIRVQGRAARWRDYAVLGAFLGFGYLAKAPLLPIGLIILVAALFVVKDWRPALKMAGTALAIFLAIGSVYFVPLSLSRGTFTLGESGKFNYLIHVDRVRPTWYFQSVGGARGWFVHPVEKIFSSPPAYAFSWPTLVTHPLRIDPSEWMAGVRPHFVLKRQIIACLPGLRNLAALQEPLAAVLIGIFVLLLVSWKEGGLPGLKCTWPIWLIGFTGCALYVPVRIETRYVAEFLVLFWFGIILGFRGPLPISRSTVRICTVLVAASLVLPLTLRTCLRYESAHKPNADAQAAAELSNLGIRPGDKVARVSPTGLDLGIERIARVEVIAEVDRQHAQEFWTAPLSTQTSLLNLFASKGAKAVIATLRQPEAGNRPGWTHLGSTQYWAWLPKSSH